MLGAVNFVFSKMEALALIMLGRKMNQFELCLFYFLKMEIFAVYLLFSCCKKKCFEKICIFLNRGRKSVRNTHSQ